MVLMDDVEVRKHRPYCTIHNKSLYSEKYDAYYCPECDRWLEEKCSAQFCDFCFTRPESPNHTHGF